MPYQIAVTASVNRCAVASHSCLVTDFDAVDSDTVDSDTVASDTVDSERIVN